MKDVKGAPLADTAAFRLGRLGALAADRFTARIAAHGVKPKHVALLAALAAGGAESQQDLAGVLRVAPSLVVGLADRLEQLGAVRRERDPVDRRRQVLSLTEAGHTLLAQCTADAHAVDAELLDGLSGKAKETLRATLAEIADRHGLSI
ncbi:MarR family winged helix-turn-helix transcriptional regulator [Yinghuangia soli]|uniref:MarR family transcriptional regulator n=1 Tax=Yinghuangia soli TaxID=2908204 RepID=A0AA41U377_9ACTN|nr:MarR family transcriptional regulator [Yinghuangia soli]MCF2532483.1 MarR family transcriptional regulator [Yinghuangia soli]